MKKVILLQLAIIASLAVVGQGIKNSKTKTMYIFKTSTLNNGKIYTEAYIRNSIFLKSQPTPCNTCYIEPDFSLPNSIADTLKKILPLKVAEMIDKNIDMLFVLQPTFTGTVVEAHCGWISDKEIKLFSESELNLIRSSLLKVSFKVNSIDKNNKSKLCQPMTIPLSNRYWKK